MGERTCPHGDPTCPCQDGDGCHYEGVDAMPCSNRPWAAYDSTMDLHGEPIAIRYEQHCHVEGCRWETETCGLARIGVKPDFPVWEEGDQVPRESIEWACGAARATAALEMEGLWS